MVQLRTRRVALALYGVLLVLPTAVLGGLQWYEIVMAHESRKAEVPRKAEDAARRLHEMVGDQVWRTVDFEDARPITHYAPYYLQAESDPATFLHSPLNRDHRPAGVMAWFTFDLDDRDAGVELFFGSPPNLLQRPDQEIVVRRAVQDLHRRWDELAEYLTDWPMPVVKHFSVCSLAVSYGDRKKHVHAKRLEPGDDRLVSVRVTPMALSFYREDDGSPRVLALRRVTMDPLEEPQGAGGCYAPLRSGLDHVQGFFLDPAWLFDELPMRVSRRVLDQDQRFVPRDCLDCCQGRIEYHAEIRLIDELGFKTFQEDSGDFAPLKVAVDTGHLDRRFRSQAWRFLGMAGMLTLSLATGLLLLLRSVNKDLRQARRTENFVAAVTHELRTPLSAIKLHGEMLLDGWATEEPTRREYYQRIVRETDRLSTLVERVLEKSRLASSPVKPMSGNLNRAIEDLQEQLSATGTTSSPDLAYDLDPDLPAIDMTVEAVSSILVNLVENARKYGGVDVDDPEAEPIRIRTRRMARSACLEVMDRGPGIAPEERKHIFEAFYRIGNEATRTSRGTGLGLHLVAIQAQSLGAEVGVEAREGGGTTFSVRFPASTT